MTLTPKRLKPACSRWLALAVLLALICPAAPAWADGIIIPEPPPDQQSLTWRDVPMTIKYHRVEVEIDGQVATTRVDQVFVNDASFTVEGTYIFPLPEDAAISSFDMTVDGVRYEGTLMGRDEARAIYEDIVRRQRDPALLEYVGRGAFQASIFPIPPGAERRIELSYSQVLKLEDGLVHYRYPLNTEKFTARPIQDVSVTVEIRESAPIRAVYSPSHPIGVSREEDGAVTASYEATDVRPDRDFDLYYSLSPDDIAVNLLSYKVSGEDGAFLLLVTPPTRAPAVPVAKDVVLVFDTSGSMEGKKMEQARAAAAYVLDHLNEGDRFNILGFASGVHLFAEEPQTLDRLEEGRAFVADLEAAGSTNYSRALQEAVAGVSPDRPTILIFMTDGLPTAGETDPDRIVAGVTGLAPKSVRLFAFGVGYDVDAVLLDQLSGGLRGVSAYVRPDDSIEEAVSGLYQKLAAPVLVDLSMRFAGVEVSDLLPSPLPDLFAGAQLVVAGRYRQGGEAELDLRGTVNGEGQAFRYRGLRFAARGGDDSIPRIWAQRKIAALLTDIRLHGANQERVQEVMDLSLRWGIVTPYTSFLVQEPQPPAQAPVDAEQGAPALAGAPTEAPPPPELVVVETVVVEKAVELMAPGERAGEAAVERAAAEQALAAEPGLAGPAGAEQMRQAGDKAFVWRSGTWVDTAYDPATMKPQTIAFGSDRYFQFLTDHPEIGPYLSLGDRLILVLEGLAYAIGPEGQQAAVEPATGESEAPAVENDSAAAPVPAPAAPCASLPAVLLLGAAGAVLAARRRII